MSVGTYFRRGHLPYSFSSGPVGCSFVSSGRLEEESACAYIGQHCSLVLILLFAINSWCRVVLKIRRRLFLSEWFNYGPKAPVVERPLRTSVHQLCSNRNCRFYILIQPHVFSELAKGPPQLLPLTPGLLVLDGFPILF